MPRYDECGLSFGAYTSKLIVEYYEEGGHPLEIQSRCLYWHNDGVKVPLRSFEMTGVFLSIVSWNSERRTIRTSFFEGMNTRMRVESLSTPRKWNGSDREMNVFPFSFLDR